GSLGEAEVTFMASNQRVPLASVSQKSTSRSPLTSPGVAVQPGVQRPTSYVKSPVIPVVTLNHTPVVPLCRNRSVRPSPLKSTGVILHPVDHCPDLYVNEPLPVFSTMNHIPVVAFQRKKSVA